MSGLFIMDCFNREDGTLNLPFALCYVNQEMGDDESLEKLAEVCYDASMTEEEAREICRVKYGEEALKDFHYEEFELA